MVLADLRGGDCDGFCDTLSSSILKQVLKGEILPQRSVIFHDVSGCFTIYTLHILFIYSSYTLHILFIYSLHTLYILFIYSSYTLDILLIYSFHTFYILFIYRFSFVSLYILFIYYSYNVHCISLYAQICTTVCNARPRSLAKAHAKHV